MSDELIRQLVLDLQPVERLGSPARRSLRFAVPAAVVTLVSAGLIGFRADLALKLVDPVYLLETAALTVLFAGATFLALCSGIPGARSPLTVRLVALAACVWLVFVGASYLLTPAAHSSLTSGIGCVRRTLLLACAPATALFILMRRSVPLQVRSSGSLVMLAAGALALLGTRALCGKDDAPHVLLWHALPLAALALFGWLIGRALLGVAERRVKS